MGIWWSFWILVFIKLQRLCYSSASRAPTSATSSVLPRHPGTVARARDRPSLQAYFQQSNNNPSARNPVISTARRSTGHRGSAQAAPVASSSDPSGGFYFLSSNSSRNFHEVENPHRDSFHGWDRERQPLFSTTQVERESIWGPFHPPPPAPGASETGMRSGNFRQRHGSERTPSQHRS